MYSLLYCRVDSWRMWDWLGYKWECGDMQVQPPHQLCNSCGECVYGSVDICATWTWIRSSDFPGYLLQISGLYAISCTWNCARNTQHHWGGPFRHWDCCYTHHLASVQVSVGSCRIRQLPKIVALLQIFLTPMYISIGNFVGEKPPNFTSSYA